MNEEVDPVTDTTDWEIPPRAQPKPEDVSFDLDKALSAVLSVRAEIPEDAFTASILGTERAGHGVLIRADGLVLTIGYLVSEAETIWLTANDGSVVPGHVLGYDQTTGFGLLQALGRFRLPALELGSAAASRVGDRVVVAGQGGRAKALLARVASKREFAGYWEYVLDEAIFTAPAHPNWGGAACIDRNGRLLGIGSLLVQAAGGDGSSADGNMIVPIDLLPPILDDLLKLGRVNQPPRPWLGMYTTEFEDNLVVAGLARGGPAHRAGIQVGDIVLNVAGAAAADLADLFRKVWALGAAGVEVPLTVVREGSPVNVRVRSADRNDFLKRPSLH